MEVCIVKDEVKIIPVTEALSRTNKYNKYLEDVKISREEDWYATPKPLDQSDLTVLTVSNLPVSFTSVCSDASANKFSQRFAERLEWMLKRKMGDADSFANIKMKLIISNSQEGYFLLSSKSSEDSKDDFFRRLHQIVDNCPHEFSIEVSFSHLSAVDDVVSPEALICLKVNTDDYCIYSLCNQVGNSFPVEIPSEMTKWWDQGDGFIYCKITLKSSLNAHAVDLLYGGSQIGNKRLLGLNGNFTDLEIECNDGKIVKCHRLFLAQKSKVLRETLENMEKWQGRVGPWKLTMKRSKEVVDAFLEHMYSEMVHCGIWSCGVALELLKMGWEYEVDLLRKAMDEIIMAKESSDFMYFKVKDALDLFLYGRENLEKLGYLRDKAVRVLQNYSKTANDKLMGSKEYQDLFKHQPRIAMELSSLYNQFS